MKSTAFHLTFFLVSKLELSTQASAVRQPKPSLADR